MLTTGQPGKSLVTTFDMTNTFKEIEVNDYTKALNQVNEYRNENESEFLDNNNNFDEFINSRSNIPKILLFTNKKNIPLIFKRLSLQFDVSK